MKQRQSFLRGGYAVLAQVSLSYSPPKGTLPTRYSPVRRFTRSPKGTFSRDLHVLGTPPAFVLSQDQTLQFEEVCSAQIRSLQACARYSVFKEPGSPKGLSTSRLLTSERRNPRRLNRGGLAEAQCSLRQAAIVAVSAAAASRRWSRTHQPIVHRAPEATGKTQAISVAGPGNLAFTGRPPGVRIAACRP